MFGLGFGLSPIFLSQVPGFVPVPLAPIGGDLSISFMVSADVPQALAPIGNNLSMEFDVPAGPVDTTAPELTNPTGAATGQVTASAGIDTNEATGTIYRVTVPGAEAAPSAIQVESGQNAAGTAANSASMAVTSFGTKTFPEVSGLTANTSYKNHFMHKDGSGNRSLVSSSIAFTTDAIPAGLSGVDTPVTIINDTGNKASYSGTVAVVAGRKLIVHAYAWTGTGGQNPTTEWTATFDGAAITPIAQTFNAGMNMAGAVYEIDVAATGTKTLAITLGAAGRGLFAHGWPDLQGFGTPAVQSSGNNSAYTADVTTLTVPTAFTPAQAGNAILSSIMVRGAGQAATVTCTGADGFLAEQTGTNATSDFTSVRAWGVINPLAATTFDFDWTTAARACGLRTEIKKG